MSQQPLSTLENADLRGCANAGLRTLYQSPPQVMDYILIRWSQLDLTGRCTLLSIAQQSQHLYLIVPSLPVRVDLAVDAEPI